MAINEWKTWWNFVAFSILQHFSNNSWPFLFNFNQDPQIFISIQIKLYSLNLPNFGQAIRGKILCSNDGVSPSNNLELKWSKTLTFYVPKKYYNGRICKIWAPLHSISLKYMTNSSWFAFYVLSLHTLSSHHFEFYKNNCVRVICQNTWKIGSSDLVNNISC